MKNEIKVLSLFDGISCGLQALKESNIKVGAYYSSEIDKDCIRISQKNHPEIIRIGDVNNIDFNLYKDVDLILAGSPCQGFSYQGKELGFEDPRSKLFYKFIEALNIIKPKFFLLENVVMKKEWLEIINKETGVNGFLLSSKFFSAQHRKRYYWTNIPFEKHNIEDTGIKFKDIQDVGASVYYTDSDIEKLKTIRWNTIKRHIARAHIYMDTKYPTLWGRGYGYPNVPFVKINSKYRLLTILECERLQTLPDNYTYLEGLSNSKRYCTLSNGWNVATIKHIIKPL